MASPEGTEVLDAVEYREAKQPMRKMVNPRHSQGGAAGRSSYPLDEGLMKQQEHFRQPPPQKSDMSINLISCASNAQIGAPLRDSVQERDMERRTRDMQIAPDEPSELLVRPAERLTSQTTMKTAEKSSLTQAEK